MSERSDDRDPFAAFGDEGDEMFARRDRGGDRGRQRSKVVSEFVRRALENTFEQVQNTGSLSKDAITYLLQQGDKGKREIVRIVSKEVGDFLRGVDLSTEVIKVLSGVQVDVSASIRFRPTGGEAKVSNLSPELEVNKSSVRFQGHDVMTTSDLPETKDVPTSPESSGAESGPTGGNPEGST